MVNGRLGILLKSGLATFTIDGLDDFQSFFLIGTAVSHHFNDTRHWIGLGKNLSKCRSIVHAYVIQTVQPGSVFKFQPVRR